MNICKHCEANLNDGDIFDVLKMKHSDLKDEIIEEYASGYGWTKENKKQFSRKIIVQPVNKPQYEMCPDCNGIWPN